MDKVNMASYTYESGYFCFVLHTDKKPTQANIILECTRQETIDFVYARMKEREGR